MGAHAGQSIPRRQRRCLPLDRINRTERKLAAEALAVSESRYARAMEASEAGHFEWDIATD
jgi:PAS domain-containing protein